jgi:adenine phosphoribosyltransferase
MTKKEFTMDELKQKIREIQDFPIPGISFKDVTTLFQDGEAFSYTIRKLADLCREKNIEVVAGPEARGFLVGTPLAYELGIGFVPIRKSGKLPCEVLTGEYDLEYGTAVLEIHKDAIQPGQRVLVVDDLLATGGTIFTTIDLIEKLGGVVAGVAFIIELLDLNGRKNLSKYDVISLITY